MGSGYGVRALSETAVLMGPPFGAGVAPSVANPESSAAWPATAVVTIAGADHILHGRGRDVMALEWLPVVLA